MFYLMFNATKLVIFNEIVYFCRNKTMFLWHKQKVFHEDSAK